MISKRIFCKPGNDNYARLANYIAGQDHAQQQDMQYGTYSPEHYIETGQSIAGNRLRRLSECHLALGPKGQERNSKGILSFDARTDRRPNDSLRRDTDDPREVNDKCIFKWCEGCWAGDDYELGIQEVEDTQALNTRTTQEKTYHLIVSFRPEDEDKLTPEAFKAIERRFAAALGLSEHQRHCGVHVNTNHIHLHVAYNLIHPEKLTRIEPYRDFIKRDKLCREIEKEYGLTVDNGREKRQEHTKSEKAANMEAHTGLTSFSTWAHEQGEAILEKLESAKSWADVHNIFAEHGMELKRRGAGMVVKNRHGKQTVKASEVHRKLSLKKLEEKFGAFEPYSGKLPESQVFYNAKPIQKAADRNRLWEEFQSQKQQQKSSIEAIKEKWVRKRNELHKRAIAKRTRTNLLKLTRQYEIEEIQKVRDASNGNWLSFLKEKANNGDETALAILRSRKEEIEEQVINSKQESQRAFMQKKTKILEDTNYSNKTKNRLISVALMEEIAGKVNVSISSYGSIIYTLENGGKICDTGKTISFTKEAKSTAIAYMSAKWNVKKQRVDKDKGEIVYTLSGDRTMRVKVDANVFERPAYHKQIKKEKDISIEI